MKPHSLLHGVRCHWALHPSRTFIMEIKLQSPVTITCCSTGVLSPLLHLSYVIDPHPRSFNVCVSNAEPEGAVPERSTSYQSFNVVAHERLRKFKKKKCWFVDYVWRWSRPAWRRPTCSSGVSTITRSASLLMQSALLSSQFFLTLRLSAKEKK